MQVKKFEAKTMKDALEMVKNDLGPDAIILRVKDNSRGFGLVGSSSVEVTAAVSEVTLKKKAFVENRLRAADKEKLKNAPAAVQRRVIEKTVSKYNQANQAASEPLSSELRRSPTSRQYADISDEEGDYSGQNVEAVLRNMLPPPAVASAYAAAAEAPPAANPHTNSRVSGAIQSAAKAFKAVTGSGIPDDFVARPSAKAAHDEEEVSRLRAQIEELKITVDRYRQAPTRTIVNMHPGADYGIPYELSPFFERLQTAGLNLKNTVEILRAALQELGHEKCKRKSLVEAWCAHHILKTLDVLEDPMDGRVHVFVGPGGQGKTSMLAKLASHLVVKKKKRVALLTIDCFKIGAVDQLKIYAQILNGAFGVIRERNDWFKWFQTLANADVILVDAPGFSLQSADEIDQFRRLMPPPEVGAKVHLVLGATNRDAELAEAGRRYAVAKYNDVIFTHIDGASTHGAIYNFQKYFEVPLHSFSTGPKIPGDFEPATKERVLDLIFNITEKSHGRIGVSENG